MKFNYIFIFIFCCISFNVFSNEYEVNSDSGHTIGYLKNNVIHWDDIPYAKPPVGDLRWRAPKKLDNSARKNSIKPKENNFCVQEPSGLGGSEGNGLKYQTLKNADFLLKININNKVESLNISSSATAVFHYIN